MTTNFADERHALYVGAVMGLAMRNGIPLVPVGDDEGNFTDRIEVTLCEGWTLTVVVPPPPDDWTLASWMIDADSDEEYTTCPAMGVYGIHSDGYFDDSSCQWCGERSPHSEES